MTTLGPIHNPDNLTAAQIGTAEGWRLLREKEFVEPEDEFWSDFDETWSHVVSDDGKPQYTFGYAHRTRHPDPLSPPAEKRPTLNGWTRFSDAMPTGPFFAGKGTEVCPVVWKASETPDATARGWTHWHPAPPLPEPPSEETQTEKDSSAFENWMLTDFTATFEAAWHAALVWERAEVAKMLPESDGYGNLAGGYNEWKHAIDAIRARVGGGK